MKTLNEQLKEWEKQNTLKKRTEKLSESDLRELMGVKQPKYYRSKGAWRSR